MLTIEQIDLLISDLKNLRRERMQFSAACKKTAELSISDSISRFAAANRRADQTGAEIERLEYDLHCDLVEARLCDPYPADYYGGHHMEPVGAFGDMGRRGERRIPHHPKLLQTEEPK